MASLGSGPNFPAAAPAAEPPANGHTSGGLVFEVADDLHAVLQAWELAYTAYRRTGRIEFNHEHLYTLPQAVSPQSAVILGRINDLAVSTLTCILDGPAGLPLAATHRTEVETLRLGGSRLMEVTLLGDRRGHLTRSMSAIFNLLRFAFYFGWHQGVHHIIVAAAPEHETFLARCFGFETLAAPAVCPAAKSYLILPMKLDLAAALARETKPRGLAFCLENPLGPEVFEPRFAFDPASVNRSPIGQFLRSDGGLVFPTSDPRAPIPAA